MTIHLTNGNGENSNVDGSSLSPTIKVGKKKNGLLSCRENLYTNIVKLCVIFFSRMKLWARLTHLRIVFIFGRINLLRAMISQFS